MQNTSLASSVCEVTSVNGASDAVRVLIVDDDDLFRETLGLNLVEEGYEVTSLSSCAGPARQRRCHAARLQPLLEIELEDIRRIAARLDVRTPNGVPRLSSELSF